ncbi:calmodulin-like protein 4 [Mizuhopecten yessoensis]|uniref:Calmodulin-like protein 4 n=1 Tax=Mizuhopecten yessoensis TaxID=6573 RepID=A0A210QLK7_MIZYE|nr:calmodulin-like protein 4 [Mizuhopecten yessoensis]OWF49623.1 Calmodulin-like protein 4 [Mizuhopecten yessoensis]
MAYSFSQTDIDRFKECFFYYARKGNIASKEELGYIMQSLGYSPTPEEVTKYFTTYSKNSNNIDFASFLEAMHDHSKVENVDKELLNAFVAHDQEKRGYVQASEVRNILMKIGVKLSRGEVDALFRETKVAPGGQIRYHEFLKTLLMPVPDY